MSDVRCDSCGIKLDDVVAMCSGCKLKEGYIAIHLYEQWVNGNRKDVMEALAAMSSMRASCAAAELTVLLMDDRSDQRDARLFIDMLGGRS